MRVLLDTNIIINREDNKIINEDLQILMKVIYKLNVSVVLHPKCIEDINRDKDDGRKKIILSKFKSYPLLEDFPKPTEEFINIVGKPVKPNDIIDFYLLFAIYNNAVNFLITEDNGIHKKAKVANLSDRVLKIVEALDLFKELLPKKVRLPPALRETTMSNLNVNEPIFDALREDYPDFNNWFADKARDGRKCWINKRDDGLLGAVLIYKIEQEAIGSSPILPRRRRLKIATMMVSHVGHKIGELLLRKSFEFAIKNKIPEIYLTHFPKEDDYLADLIQEYGFTKVSIQNRDWTAIPEDVFLKKIFIKVDDITGLSPFQISKTFFPNFYDGNKVKKHIIPIQPQFHERLFTDFPSRQTKLYEHIGEFIIAGNTIKKAYLSRSSTRKMEPGHIILFYRSIDVKSVVSLGVIESIYYDLTDPNEIMSIVGKRTVYSMVEIEKFAKSPTTVILFNHHFHFKTPIKYKKMLELNIIRGYIQSITEIDHEKYLKIKRRGGINERFTFN